MNIEDRLYKNRRDSTGNMWRQLLSVPLLLVGTVIAVIVSSDLDRYFKDREHYRIIEELCPPLDSGLIHKKIPLNDTLNSSRFAIRTNSRDFYFMWYKNIMREISIEDSVELYTPRK